MQRAGRSSPVGSLIVYTRLASLLEVVRHCVHCCKEEKSCFVDYLIDFIACVVHNTFTWLLSLRSPLANGGEGIYLSPEGPGTTDTGDNRLTQIRRWWLSVSVVDCWFRSLATQHHRSSSVLDSCYHYSRHGRLEVIDRIRIQRPSEPCRHCTLEETRIRQSNPTLIRDSVLTLSFTEAELQLCCTTTVGISLYTSNASFHSPSNTRLLPPIHACLNT